MNITHLQESIKEREEHIEELENTNSFHPEALQNCIDWHRGIILKDEDEIRQYLAKDLKI